MSPAAAGDLPRYRTVLCATDFSEQAGHATDLAVRLAARFGARLVVLHVIEYPDVDLERFDVEYDFDAYRESLVEEAEDHLRADVAARAEADAEVETLITEGASGPEISRVAGDVGADLIVVGATGHSGIGRVVFGTTPEAVVRDSGCPVLVVRRSVPEEAFRHVLVATDFSAASADAVPHAAAFARAHDARLTILHVAAVYPTTRYGPEIDETAREALEQGAEKRLAAISVPAADLKIEARVVRAYNAQEGILRAAEDDDADLVVVGTHGRGGIGRALLGSTAGSVVRHAHCPVLTVRPASQDAGE